MPRKKIELPDTLEPEVPAESVATETQVSEAEAETTISAKTPPADKPKPRKPRKKKEPATPLPQTPEPSGDVEVPAGTSLESALDEIVKTLGGDGTGSDESRPDVPEIINILPLRDSVIYPMLIAPLSVSRESGVQLIDESVVGNNRVIGVVAQRQPQEENPNFDDVFEYGCAVIIRTLVKMPDAVRLIVQGVARFKIVERIQDQPYLRARIELITEPTIDPARAEELEALKRSVSALFEQAIRLSPNLPDELRSLTHAVQEPNVVADLVAAHMSFGVEDKQRILETQELEGRLKLLLEILGKEVRVLELSSKVQNEVNTELSKTQRDYYLREQLKAIQRELGEIDDRGEELEELFQKITEAQLPEAALKEVNREFDRLRRMNPGSPEYTVARTYIDAMIAMPWNHSTVDNLDLQSAKDTLDIDHYGLEKIKDRILEFLSVRKVKTDGNIRQPILCFAGPPGVGKTSLARSIANALGRKYARISLGGVRDEAEIRGHRRTYIGAMPGQVMQTLRRVESQNPVIVLDEIDKLSNDHRGDPSSALLEVLDPEQNFAFRDHYLDVPFDLSRVFFIATANRLDTIPPALRDRMEVIELGGYTEEEKIQIAIRHLIPKQIEEHGLKPKQIEFTPEAVHNVVRFYTREAGVRNLEREIGSVVRKVTRKFAEGNRRKITVNAKFVESALGAPRYLHDEVMERKLPAGTAVGLAWTPVGGDVLFIESALMPGKKGLTVTGQLGDVMKESVSAAMSFLRSHAAQYHITREQFDENDIHVHVPAGAVPKDGPSAGVTMLTALTSLLTDTPVMARLAMTGEITLSGQVLPVGGIKEKILAAQRAGVETVILPKRNEKDYLEDVPADIRKLLRAHFVTEAAQVLKIALNK